MPPESPSGEGHFRLVSEGKKSLFFFCLASRKGRTARCAVRTPNGEIPEEWIAIWNKEIRATGKVACVGRQECLPHGVIAGYFALAVDRLAGVGFSFIGNAMYCLALA